MQAPGCTSPGKDHADSALVLLMEYRKRAFGGMRGCVEGGRWVSSCHIQGRGRLPWLSEICWDVAPRALQDRIVFRVKGGALRSTAFSLPRAGRNWK